MKITRTYSNNLDYVKALADVLNSKPALNGVVAEAVVILSTSSLEFNEEYLPFVNAIKGIRLVMGPN